MTTQRQLESLRPFKPGVSGNPNGRPKGPSILRLVLEYLAQLAGDGSELTNAHLVAATWVNLAKKGDRTLLPLLVRYVDGDPKAAADLTLRELIGELAERMGLDPNTLAAEFERDLKAG